MIGFCGLCLGEVVGCADPLAVLAGELTCERPLAGVLNAASFRGLLLDDVVGCAGALAVVAGEDIGAIEVDGALRGDKLFGLRSAAFQCG